MAKDINNNIFGKKIDIQDLQSLRAAILSVNNLMKKGISLDDAVKTVTSSGHPHIVVNFTQLMKTKGDKDIYNNIYNELKIANMKKEKKQEMQEEYLNEQIELNSKIVSQKIGSVMQDAIDRKNGFYTAKERKLVMKFNKDPNKRIEDQEEQAETLESATNKLRQIMEQEEAASNVTRKIIKKDRW